MLMIAGGLTLAMWTGRQTFDPVSGPLTAGEMLRWITLLMVGLALALGGCFVARGMRKLASFALTICECGFYCSRGGLVSVLGFADITRVDETVVHEKLPSIKAVTDKAESEITSHYYEVYRCDGERFYFDGNNLPRTCLLSGQLKKAKVTHGFQWNRREITR